MQNYKVFINNSLIFFGKREDFLPKDYLYSDFQYISPDGMGKLVHKIESFQEIGHIFIETKEPEETFRDFASYFKTLLAAGGLVLNNMDQIIMIHRFGYWDFPKGKVEKGESLEAAGIRETEEETGVKGLSIIKKLPTVYHIYNYSNKWILKETAWFLMKTDYCGLLTPQLEEEIMAAKWIPIDFLNQYIEQSYSGLQILVEECELLR